MPRILFVKTSSLGDVIHHCPAVTDVARSVPGCEIDWVVEESFAAIPRMHRAVRRVVPVAIRRWRRAPFRRQTWREVERFREAMRAEAYDAVVDTQGLLKSALLCALARGHSHGFDAESAREALAARLYHVRHAVPRAQHAVTRNRALTAAALGYRVPDGCDYGLSVTHATDDASQAPYVILLTMTSRPAKLWNEAHWVEVAAALSRRGVRPVLPWGNDEERMRCERIARALAVPGEGVAPHVPARMPIDALASLIAGARAVAGVDTGLVHLAVALGVPSIGIYVQTDPTRTGLHGGALLRNLGSPGNAPSPADVSDALKALG